MPNQPDDNDEFAERAGSNVAAMVLKAIETNPGLSNAEVAGLVLRSCSQLWLADGTRTSDEIEGALPLLRHIDHLCMDLRDIHAGRVAEAGRALDDDGWELEDDE